MSFVPFTRELLGFGDLFFGHLGGENLKVLSCFFMTPNPCKIPPLVSEGINWRSTWNKLFIGYVACGKMMFMIMIG